MSNVRPLHEPAEIRKRLIDRIESIERAYRDLRDATIQISTATMRSADLTAALKEEIERLLPEAPKQ